jgi:penicillin-binding protein 2
VPTFSSFIGRPGGRSPGSAPVLGLRLAILAAAAIAVVGLLILRLWFLQVVSSGDYTRQANENRYRRIFDEPPRGAIQDRKGRFLVTNRQVLNVTARPTELGWKQGDKKDSEGNTIPGEPDAAGKRTLTRLARVAGKGPADFILNFRKGAQATPLREIVVVKDAKPSVVNYLSERQRTFPGIGLQNSYVRSYPEGPLAAQLLGIVNAINKDNVREYKRRGYSGTEEVGQGGIEGRFEDYLRGRVGERQVEVNSNGEVVGAGPVSAKPAVPGKSVQLTIDNNVNKVLQDAIAVQVARAGSPGGAGIAMDPNTGEILGMASIPSFDPTIFVSGTEAELRSVLLNKGKPAENKALTGEYPPGSTFKPFTATGYIESGYVAPSDVRPCPSIVTLYDRPWTNFKEQFHSDVALAGALEVSCDTYFYNLAALAYEATRKDETTFIQDWVEAFGYGTATGVDVGQETAGVVPDREWREKEFANSPVPTDRDWRPGDAINLSVGQGDVKVSPLQQAVAFAAIANGGDIVRPRVVRKVVASDESSVVDYTGQVTKRPVQLGDGRAPKPETWAAIRRGLYLAANGTEGTARNVFQNLPDGAKVAGKTGTAENFVARKVKVAKIVGGKTVVVEETKFVPDKDHGWFVGYAPADGKPQIVVAVVIAKAGTGASVAAPVVCATITTFLAGKGVKVDPKKDCGSGDGPDQVAN